MFLTSWPNGIAASNGLTGRVRPAAPRIGGLLSPADRAPGQVDVLNPTPAQQGSTIAKRDHRNRVVGTPPRSVATPVRPKPLPQAQKQRQTMMFGRPIMAVGTRAKTGRH